MSVDHGTSQSLSYGESRSPSSTYGMFSLLTNTNHLNAVAKMTSRSSKTQQALEFLTLSTQEKLVVVSMVLQPDHPESTAGYLLARPPIEFLKGPSLEQPKGAC